MFTPDLNKFSPANAFKKVLLPDPGLPTAIVLITLSDVKFSEDSSSLADSTLKLCCLLF